MDPRGSLQRNLFPPVRLALEFGLTYGNLRCVGDKVKNFWHWKSQAGGCAQPSYLNVRIARDDCNEIVESEDLQQEALRLVLPRSRSAFCSGR